MGQSQNLQGTKIAVQKIINDPTNPNILINTQTQQQYQRYQTVLDQRQEALVNKRIQDKNCFIVELLYCEPAVPTSDAKSSRSYFLYTERLFSFNEKLWVSSKSILSILKGFRRLVHSYGPIGIDQAMIKSSKQGLPKVWINSNPISNLVEKKAQTQLETLNDIIKVCRQYEPRLQAQIGCCKSISQAINVVLGGLVEKGKIDSARKIGSDNMHFLDNSNNSIHSSNFNSEKLYSTISQFSLSDKNSPNTNFNKDSMYSPIANKFKQPSSMAFMLDTKVKNSKNTITNRIEQQQIIKNFQPVTFKKQQKNQKINTVPNQIEANLKPYHSSVPINPLLTTSGTPRKLDQKPVNSSPYTDKYMDFQPVSYVPSKSLSKIYKPTLSEHNNFRHLKYQESELGGLNSQQNNQRMETQSHYPVYSMASVAQQTNNFKQYLHMPCFSTKSNQINNDSQPDSTHEHKYAKKIQKEAIINDSRKNNINSSNPTFRSNVKYKTEKSQEFGSYAYSQQKCQSNLNQEEINMQFCGGTVQNNYNINVNGTNNTKIITNIIVSNTSNSKPKALYKDSKRTKTQQFYGNQNAVGMPQRAKTNYFVFGTDASNKRDSDEKNQRQASMFSNFTSSNAQYLPSYATKQKYTNTNCANNMNNINYTSYHSYHPTANNSNHQSRNIIQVRPTTNGSSNTNAINIANTSTLSPKKLQLVKAVSQQNNYVHRDWQGSSNSQSENVGYNSSRQVQKQITQRKFQKQKQALIIRQQMNILGIQQSTPSNTSPELNKQLIHDKSARDIIIKQKIEEKNKKHQDLKNAISKLLKQQ